MLSLYFNSKLTGRGVHDPVTTYGDTVVLSSIYCRNSRGLSQLEVLVGVIESYKDIVFENAVFNIDIAELNDDAEIKISSAIKFNINVENNLIVNFFRPSTVNEWVDDVKNNFPIIGPDVPVLVVMNHDHPFVDYNIDAIGKIVKDVFGVSGANFGKVLPYSHASEVISYVLNNKYKFRCVDGVYSGRYKTDWLDSICIISMNTLLHVFNNIVTLGDGYVGRFDWPGVYYRKKILLEYYVYPREFFRHYDGYSHVTGLRLGTELTCTPFMYQIPLKGREKMIDFYYQRWIDCYLLFLRDYMRKCTFFHDRRKYLKKGIDISLRDFCVVYLDQDMHCKIISKSDRKAIVAGLLDKIYYNFNFLFHEIDLDVRLKQKSILSFLRESLSHKSKALIKYYFNWMLK